MNYALSVLLPTQFVDCRVTRLELNSQGPYPSSEREIKLRRYLSTFSIKRKVWHFHVVVVQNKYVYAKGIFIVFLLKPIVFVCFCFCLFFDVLFAVAYLDLKVPMFPANQEEVMLFDGLS